MFNRVIRDKIPGIQDFVGEFSDSAEKDRDCKVKQKGKEIADKRRGAREADISVGDKVVLKNVVFRHKLTPNFDTTEYEVVERKGNIVKVVGEGRTLMRNVSHLKKLPQQSTQPDASNIDRLPMLDAGQSLDPETPPSLPTPEENETHNMDALKLKLVRKEGM